MKSWIVLVALILAGCAGKAPIEEPARLSGPATEEATGGIQNASYVLGGFLYYRLPGDTPPLTKYDGDPPLFCFTLPSNATRLTAHYEWDRAPQPMDIEFHPPSAKGASESDKWTVVAGTTPPLDAEIHDLEAGEWFAYAGPGGAGGATNWTLVLDFEGVSDATFSECF